MVVINDTKTVGQPTSGGVLSVDNEGHASNIFINNLGGEAEFALTKFTNDNKKSGSYVLDDCAASQWDCTGWRNGLTGTLQSSTDGNAKYCAGARITPGTGTR